MGATRGKESASRLRSESSFVASGCAVAGRWGKVAAGAGEIGAVLGLGGMSAFHIVAGIRESVLAYIHGRWVQMIDTSKGASFCTLGNGHAALCAPESSRKLDHG
jgi:hypothetical protein